MSLPTPLDPQQKAFADALGHLVAELVWREVVGAGPQDTNGGESPPRADLDCLLAGAGAERAGDTA